MHSYEDPPQMQRWPRPKGIVKSGRAILGVALLLAASFAPPVHAADVETVQEIISIRHPPSLVYFTNAPPRVRALVLRAIKHYCANPANWSHRSRDEKWAPDAALRICAGAHVKAMHGVNYRNQSNGYAYACLTELLEDDRVFPANYEEYFNTRYRCMVLYRDSETNAYRVEPPED